MITSLIIDGVAKVLWFRNLPKSKKRVCRIYPLTGVLPEKILTEVEPGIFQDTVDNIKISIAGGLAKLV